MIKYKIHSSLVLALICISLLSSCSFMDSNESVNTVEDAEDSSDPDTTETDLESSEDTEEDYTEIELISEAQRSYDAGRYMIAKNFFDKIVQNYPGSPLSLTAELKIADCLFLADRFVDAIPYYRDFAKIHSKHEARPYALFKIGESFQNTYQGTNQDLTPLKEAIKAYLFVINEYPKGKYASQAASNIRLAEEDLFKSELSVIDFYVRTGDKKSADKRILDLGHQYGHLDIYKEYSKDQELIREQAFKQEVIAQEETLTDGSIESIEIEESDNNKVEKPLETTSYSVDTTTFRSDSNDIKEDLNRTEEKALELALQAVPSPIPSATQPQAIVRETQILQTTAEPLASPTNEPKEIGIANPQNKTLADLDPITSTKETGMDVIKTENLNVAVDKGNLPNIGSESQVLMDSPNRLSEDSDEIGLEQLKGSFLHTFNCEQEDGIIKVFMNFGAKPFLKSSRKDTSNGSLNTIVFQEGFSTNPLPPDTNSDEWIKRPLKVCMQIGDQSVLIEERIKSKLGSSQFGPNSYVFVYIRSKSIEKISIVNGSSPETLAIIAQ